MIRVPASKFFTKALLDFTTSYTILSIADKVKDIRDLIILAASVVFLNAILIAIWALIKMGLRLIKRKIEIKIEKTKDEKTREIMNTTVEEIKKHIEKTDKLIDKITEKNIKNGKKE